MATAVKIGQEFVSLDARMCVVEESRKAERQAVSDAEVEEVPVASPAQLASLESRLCLLEEQVRQLLSADSLLSYRQPLSCDAFGDEYGEMGNTEARLSQLGEQLSSVALDNAAVQSASSSGEAVVEQLTERPADVAGVSSSANAWPSTVHLSGATAPQRSTVVLTLRWAGEQSLQPALDRSHADHVRDDIGDPVSALRGAVASALASSQNVAMGSADIVRADLREGPGGGAVCWLATADARAAETELRRQLGDPSSALRQMLPGLAVEGSSVVAQQHHSVSAARRIDAEQRSLSLRVEELERSLAEGLGQVEQRVLTVEKLACGAMGVENPVDPLHEGAALDDLSAIREERGGSLHHGIFDHLGHPSPRSVAGGVVRHKSPLGSETGESSREFVFDQPSFDTDNAGGASGGALNPEDWREQRLRYEAEEQAERLERERRRRNGEGARAMEAATAASSRLSQEEQEELAEEERVRECRNVQEAVGEQFRRQSAVVQDRAATHSDTRPSSAQQQPMRVDQGLHGVISGRERGEDAEDDDDSDEYEQAALDDEDGEDDEEMRRILESTVGDGDEESEDVHRTQAVAVGPEAREESGETRRWEEQDRQVPWQQRQREEDAASEQLVVAATSEMAQQHIIHAIACWSRLTSRLLERLMSEERAFEGWRLLVEGSMAIKSEACGGSSLTQNSDIEHSLAEDRRPDVRQSVTAMAMAGAENVSDGQMDSAMDRTVSACTVAIEDELPNVAREDRPRRARHQGLPLVARATKYSKDPEIRKAFDDMDIHDRGRLDFDDVRSYMCDYLGYGQLDARAFFDRYASGEGPEYGVSYESFMRGYPLMNPFKIEHRLGEVVFRKPGALNGQMLALNKLENCEVFVCDRSAQVFVDFCKSCLILLGPCESSIFARDCEDCVFWIASQQLRTNNCKGCTFYLYSKSEPVIETSTGLAFAPWTASYPKCAEHFAAGKFDTNKNMWNGIFDFTSEKDNAHWRILALDEIVSLEVEVDDCPSETAPRSNPVPCVTHQMLCADPLPSEESCGQGIADIPQSRPSLPRPPPEDFEALRVLRIRDGEASADGDCGAARISKLAKPIQTGTAAVEDPVAFHDPSSRQTQQRHDQFQQLEQPSPQQSSLVQHQQPQEGTSRASSSGMAVVSASFTSEAAEIRPSASPIPSSRGPDSARDPTRQNGASDGSHAGSTIATRVVGGMAFGDDDDSSDDGLPLPIVGGLSSHADQRSDGDVADSRETDNALGAASAAATVHAGVGDEMRRSMFGVELNESEEDDAEEEEEEEEARPSPLRRQPQFQLQRPQNLGSLAAARGIADDSDDADDAEDAFADLLTGGPRLGMRAGNSVGVGLLGGRGRGGGFGARAAVSSGFSGRDDPHGSALFGGTGSVSSLVGGGGRRGGLLSPAGSTSQAESPAGFGSARSPAIPADESIGSRIGVGAVSGESSGIQSPLGDQESNVSGSEGRARLSRPHTDCGKSGLATPTEARDQTHANTRGGDEGSGAIASPASQSAPNDVGGRGSDAGVVSSDGSWDEEDDDDDDGGLDDLLH
eukprot:TRINITY_DN16716_c0_g1_i1.p1 TRINITY_DN16716_c0_g1~~TRINITY_DN16716_c0_g1_i1.p1  ORF type:complete len:1738 (+),score=336.76 TRINITY_DN16716_c0_g1_i1:566-5215(+)